MELQGPLVRGSEAESEAGADAEAEAETEALQASPYPLPHHLGLPELWGIPVFPEGREALGWARIRWFRQSETRWPTADTPTWVPRGDPREPIGPIPAGLFFRRHLQAEYDQSELEIEEDRALLAAELASHGDTTTCKAMKLRVDVAYGTWRIRQCALELLISMPHCECMNCQDEECMNCRSSQTPDFRQGQSED